MLFKCLNAVFASQFNVIFYSCVCIFVRICSYEIFTLSCITVQNISHKMEYLLRVSFLSNLKTFNKQILGKNNFAITKEKYLKHWHD